MGYVQERLAEIQEEAITGNHMPLALYRNVERSVSKRGRVSFYYRVGKGRRIRLPDKGKVAEHVFRAAYEAAANGHVPTKPQRVKVLGEFSRPGKPGYVYFVRAGESVKIGFTTAIKQRIKSIQTGNENELELLMAMPATDETEKFFHEMFRDYRIGGEWFSLTGLLAEFVGFSHRAR